MGAGNSLVRLNSRSILFDVQNTSFVTSLVIIIYIYSINIPPYMIINRIYENRYFLSP